MDALGIDSAGKRDVCGLRFCVDQAYHGIYCYDKAEAYVFEEKIKKRGYLLYGGYPLSIYVVMRLGLA